MKHAIDDQLAQKVVVALNYALSLALMAKSPQHASLLAVAHEFDDAIRVIDGEEPEDDD